MRRALDACGIMQRLEAQRPARGLGEKACMLASTILPLWRPAGARGACLARPLAQVGLQSGKWGAHSRGLWPSCACDSWGAPAASRESLLALREPLPLAG